MTDTVRETEHVIESVLTAGECIELAALLFTLYLEVITGSPLSSLEVQVFQEVSSTRGIQSLVS
jgi:hypothetical protein